MSEEYRVLDYVYSSDLIDSPVSLIFSLRFSVQLSTHSKRMGK